MGFVKQVTERLLHIDLKWVVVTLFAIGAGWGALQFQVADNRNDIETVHKEVDEVSAAVHQMEVRTVVLETKLTNIEAYSAATLDAVDELRNSVNRSDR